MAIPLPLAQSQPHDHQKTDLQTADRVRAELKKVAARPALIQVSVQGGSALLSGIVFDAEVNQLMETARRVPGIQSVQHQFNILFSSRKIVDRQLSENHFGYQPGFIVGRWSPWVRVLSGFSGLLLVVQSLRQRHKNKNSLSRIFRPLSAGFGALLVARAVTNQEITQVAGTFILPVMRIRRTLHLNVPLEDAYRFWTHFSNYPRFMSFIQKVEINDRGGLKWVAKAPGGFQASWDTTFLGIVPQQRIAWKSVPGSLIATEGLIQFKATETEGVEVGIELSYALPAGVLGYGVAHLLGFNPKSRIDEDLEIMKLLIESSTESRRPDRALLLSDS